VYVRGRHRRGTPHRAIRRPGGVVLLLSLGLAASCRRPLPDQDGPGAQTYAEQCGLCHPAYQPGLMTAAMWEIQVGRMDEQRARRGVPPLSDADRRVILEYLKAHAE